MARKVTLYECKHCKVIGFDSSPCSCGRKKVAVEFAEAAQPRVQWTCATCGSKNIKPMEMDQRYLGG